MKTSLACRQLLVLVGLGCLLPTSPAWTQTYTITELPPLPGSVWSEALALNETGQAAGVSSDQFSDDNDMATLWTDGVSRNLQSGTTTSSLAFALNDSGHVVGNARPLVSNSFAFIWRGSTIDRITAADGSFISSAIAMNNSGTVVGKAGLLGYRWTNGSQQSPGGLLAGDILSSPSAINNLGTIVGRSSGIDNGFRPVSWVTTVPQLVPIPTPGTGDGDASDINDLGQIVGGYQISVGSRGGSASFPFFWSASTGPLALPVPPGTRVGFARAINNAGTIIGSVNNLQPVVWRKNSAGTYEAVLVSPLVKNAAGWSQLFLNAINEGGQIAGTGTFNNRLRGFILTPGPTLTLALRTDRDRDGVTNFDSPGDATSPGRPFQFWTNDDHDASGSEAETGPADSADNLISPTHQIRDLEDFARLALGLTPELRTALEAGARLTLEARGAGRIHLFPTTSDGTETAYLENEPAALAQVTAEVTNTALAGVVAPDGSVVMWTGMEKLINEADWNNWRLRLLWEGVQPGPVELTLRLTQPDGSEVVSEPVHLALHPVRAFFEHVRVTPENGFAPPYETQGAVPALAREVVHAQLVTSPDEQAVDLVWVHGWRLTDWERQNWGEIMCKRLWHARYRGRFHTFTWPTFSNDEEPKTNGLLSFDRSEHRAWKSGAVLEAYVRALRAAHPGGRLALVAHSMGNIVTGEALRRGAPADLQIMMQAAISAGAYDTRTALEEAKLLAHERKEPTPDFAAEFGYRGYFATITVPTINFFNAEDFALQSGRILGKATNWFDHQEDKPFDPNGRGEYAFRDGTPGIYGGKKLLRRITDIDESLAFIARSRTRAVGAQSLTGFTVAGAPLGAIINRVDLHGAQFGFTDKSDEHSAQFNRPIQRQLAAFYSRIVELVSPAPAP